MFKFDSKIPVLTCTRCDHFNLLVLGWELRETLEWASWHRNLNHPQDEFELSFQEGTNAD